MHTCSLFDILICSLYPDKSHQQSHLLGGSTIRRTLDSYSPLLSFLTPDFHHTHLSLEMTSIYCIMTENTSSVAHVACHNINTDHPIQIFFLNFLLFKMGIIRFNYRVAYSAIVFSVHNLSFQVNI